MSKGSKAKRIKKFNNWLEEEDFKSWLRKAQEDDTKFKCIVCMKTLTFSSSGRGAVVDHCNGTKHVEIVKRRANFFPQQKQMEVDEVQAHIATEEEKITAQIMWLITSVDSGFSNNSTYDIGDVLRRLDPNSKVLEGFNMKRTKAAYIINHRLAPYFRGILYEHIGASDVVVVSFDESHNDISKSCEMVLVVRYWSSTENCVKTRYLDSAFMGHARENDLLVNFNQMAAKLEKSKSITCRWMVPA